MCTICVRVTALRAACGPRAVVCPPLVQSNGIIFVCLQLSLRQCFHVNCSYEHSFTTSICLSCKRWMSHRKKLALASQTGNRALWTSHMSKFVFALPCASLPNRDLSILSLFFALLPMPMFSTRSHTHHILH